MVILCNTPLIFLYRHPLPDLPESIYIFLLSFSNTPPPLSSSTHCPPSTNCEPPSVSIPWLQHLLRLSTILPIPFVTFSVLCHPFKVHLDLHHLLMVLSHVFLPCSSEVWKMVIYIYIYIYRLTYRRSEERR